MSNFFTRKEIFYLMKITITPLLFVCLLTTLSFAENTFGQERLQEKITLHLKNADLKTVLKNIEQKTNVVFSYQKGVLATNEKLSLDIKEETLESVLQRILIPRQISYQVIKSNKIVLVSRVLGNVPETLEPKPAPTIFDAPLDQTITGTVTDENGMGLPGVSVLVKGTQRGTSTDANGRYKIEVANTDAILVFSFVGYLSQEVAISNQSQISISLKTDIKSLNEVVVVGYGTMRKSDLTGAVSSISGRDINTVPTSRVDQALQGRAAGVQVTSVNGAPGVGASIRIRGGNSISADNEPLFVIDGFIGGGNLNTLNTADIESLQILKDATATAIYGARGANGVVLITTKRGREGKSTFSVGSYTGWQSLPAKIPLLTGPERAQYQNEYAQNQNQNIPFPNLSQVGNYDWQQEVTQTAPMRNIDMSLSGGSSSTRFYLSGNYFNQRGIIKNSGIERFIFRLNLDHKATRWLNVGTTLNISRANQDNNVVNLNDVMKEAQTFIPFYQTDGYYSYINPVAGTLFQNPIAQYNLQTNTTGLTRMLGNFFAAATPLKGLELRSTLGVDLNFSKQNQYQSGNLPTRLAAKLGGYARVDINNAINLLNENTATYDRQLGTKHHLNVLGGFTYQTSKAEGLWASGAGFSNDALTFNRISTGVPLQRQSDTDYSQWTILSFLGRVNYSFSDRYLFTAVARQDGSSRLAANNKWAFFPSAAFAWRISEEPFMQSQTIFNSLKLRTSYGLTGNQAIDVYQSLPTLTTSRTFFRGIENIGFNQGNIANPNLRWETTRQLDIGLEGSFLKGRLSFEADYYYKRTKDLLLTVEIPFTTGYQTRLTNLGIVQNKGLELMVNATIVEKKKFSWDVSLNVAGNRNKVLDLGGKEFIDLTLGNRLIVGQPAGSFVGATYVGTWKTQEEIDASKGFMANVKPGDPRFADTNNNGKFDGYGDYSYLGSPQPKAFGGVRNVIRFNGLTLDFFWQGVFGNQIMNENASRLFFGDFASNTHILTRNRWTPQNPTSDIPRASGFIRADHTLANSVWVQDGSFARLKTARLSYTFSGTKYPWLKQASIYITGNNLLLFDKYDWGYDPEVNSFGTNSVIQGRDTYSYPQNRSILLGLNLQL